MRAGSAQRNDPVTEPGPPHEDAPPHLGLAIRRAVRKDTKAIFEVMYREPPPEVLAMAGSLEGALAFGRILPLVTEETFVSLLAGSVTGMLQARLPARDPRPAPAPLPGLVRVLVGHYPPWSWPRVLRRLTVRMRLQFPPVEGAYHVAEIHVAPERRNQGIGSRLLRFAEEQAREQGCPRLSLTTTATNPAQRLYERVGFRVVDRKTDPEYELVTGIPGRILMVKELFPIS